MVAVVTGSTPFEAKVIAARLGSEGILWELRGAVDSIYPIGEGVDVLVPGDDVERARELLLVDEVDAAFDGGEAVSSGGSIWLVVVGVLLLVAFTAARIVGLT
jgi:hypothetical protein